MAAPAAWVWLVSGYALILLAIAWGFDHMARRTSARAAEWRTGGSSTTPTTTPGSVRRTSGCGRLRSTRRTG